MRSQIVFNKRFENASTILNTEVVDLEHKSIALSKIEKQNILIKHLQRNNLEYEIKKEEVMTICETGYAFPLLCKLVSNDKERFRNRIAFFRHPVSLLNKELDKMIHENQKLYCILVLCMFCNGSFPRRIFDIDADEFDEKINRIVQTCGLPKNLSKKELKDSAESAIGSYFVIDSTNFRFMHDALEETVSCHFYKFDPREMFSCCDILFIRDRVRVHSNEKKNEHIVENSVVILENDLNEDSLKPLYDRLCTELLSGRFSILLTSKLFENSNFVRIFGTHLEKNESKQGSKNHFLKIASSEFIRKNQCSFVRKWIKKINVTYNNNAIKRVVDAIGDRRTLMHWIVAFGCNEFFQYAWSKMTTIERKRIMGRDYVSNPLVKPFFPLAVLGGSLDIVTELVCYGADVNCFSEFWETPLYIALRLGRSDIVYFLIRNGAKVNLRGWFSMNIPILVDQKSISLLLQYDSNQTELHTAVQNNDLESLRSNIRSGNIDSKAESGWTVLHYAVLLNNVDAVKVLFHEDLSQNDDLVFDITQVEQKEGSDRKLTPKISIGDNNGLTAMHVAVINNNIEIIRLLRRNKADVKVRDDFDRTPLHYIKGKRATRLLLKYISRKQTFRQNVFSRAFTGSLCFNITLQTSLRNIVRDFVNIPDREGNTPLHCVLKRSLLEQERNDCIQILRKHGALTDVFNDSGTLALQLTRTRLDMIGVNPKTRFKNTKSTRLHFHLDTFIYSMNNSATSRQLIRRHLLCSVSMFVLWLLSLSLIFSFGVFEGDVQNSVSCIGQVEEYDSITLMKMTRSIYLILITSPFLLLLSITKLSVFLGKKLLSVEILGCCSLILLGLFAYVPYVYNHVCGIMFFVIFCSLKLIMSIVYNVVRVRSSFVYVALWVFILIVTLVSGLNAVMSKYLLYTVHDLNSLTITASNCTEFSSVNISCTRFANNRTYKHVIDFSARCLTDPTLPSYNGTNGTHGTLTVESELIDLSKLSFHLFKFCLLFWLHAIFTYGLLDSLSLVFVKVNKDLIPVALYMYILGIGMILPLL